MSSTSTRETLGFQTEVKQLLGLMIHSLYSNPEIFLRELISNASDACDRLRFEALTANALYENDPDLRIRIAFDPRARTITVTDNGSGMSRDEVQPILAVLVEPISIIGTCATEARWDAVLGGSPAAICRYCKGYRQRNAPRSPRPSGLWPGRSAAALPSLTISTYGLRRAPCIRSVLAATHHAPIYEIGSSQILQSISAPRASVSSDFAKQNRSTLWGGGWR